MTFASVGRTFTLPFQREQQICTQICIRLIAGRRQLQDFGLRIIIHVIHCNTKKDEEELLNLARLPAVRPSIPTFACARGLTDGAPLPVLQQAALLAVPQELASGRVLFGDLRKTLRRTRLKGTPKRPRLLGPKNKQPKARFLFSSPKTRVMMKSQRI